MRFSATNPKVICWDPTRDYRNNLNPLDASLIASKGCSALIFHLPHPHILEKYIFTSVFASAEIEENLICAAAKSFYTMFISVVIWAAQKNKSTKGQGKLKKLHIWQWPCSAGREIPRWNICFLQFPYLSSEWTQWLISLKKNPNVTIIII